MLRGDAAPEAVGALLMLLPMKGETAEEIAGFARAGQAHLPALPWRSSALAKALRCPVYVADQPDWRDITTPAIVDRDPVVVDIGSNGTAPVPAQRQPPCAAEGPVGAKTGQSLFVGAGPGARDLLTLRAIERLQEANMIFYDQLVDEEVLERARRDAERLFVGKHIGTFMATGSHRRDDRGRGVPQSPHAPAEIRRTGIFRPRI